MSQILNKVRDVDPNNSDAVKEVLTSFFQNVTKHTEVNCYQWLETLEYILIRFPKYCSTHRVNIETYLANFLTASNYHDVIEAAKCAHALQQVQWPQDRTSTSKSAWRDQMELLCDAAHSLTDAILVESLDSHKGKDKRNKTRSNSNSPLLDALNHITAISNPNTNKQVMLQNKIRNIFIFMQAMLVEIYPVPKPIRPQTILDVIVCSLTVTSVKDLQIMDIVGAKIEALRTLDALIASVGANLIPFSALVFRIVMQTLGWTKDNPGQGTRKVRQFAYSTLVNWLTTLHTHHFITGNPHWEDQLTKDIISDTTPTRKTVQLTMSSQPLKNLSKKAKRKLQNTMLKESTISAHMPGEKNKHIMEKENDTELSISALECAEVFLSTCGVFLKPKSHKMLQEHFVRECYKAETYNSDYVLSLLRVLEALRKTTPPTVPPPTQYCLHLYSTLTNNQSTEISKFCSQALLNIRLHLHCSPPTISFALEESTEKNRENKLTQKLNAVSDRNIAALEKLLGPNILSQNGDSMKNASEEPLYKKSRLDLEIDNISISSASGSSVVVYDPADDNDEASKGSVDKNISGSESQAVHEECNQNDNNDNSIKQISENKENNNVDAIKGNNENANLDKQVIYEAETQIPLTPLNDRITPVEDLVPSLNNEISYDYPNADNRKVTVLDKMDDDDLPNTNDTDDIKIACGQEITSQENDLENSSIETANETKAIEIDETSGNIHEVATQLPTHVANKLSESNGVTVEDMMADFVDEVDESVET